MPRSVLMVAADVYLSTEHMTDEKRSEWARRLIDHEEPNRFRPGLLAMIDAWELASRHEVKIVPVQKMDTRHGLYTWECSCGRRGNATGSESHARRAGSEHHMAMTNQDR